MTRNLSPEFVCSKKNGRDYSHDEETESSSEEGCYRGVDVQVKSEEAELDSPKS